MRIRSTKPEFWRSERIASVSWDARLVLKGLESYVDDNGVGKDDIALIVSDVFPRDLARESPGTLKRVTEAISELHRAGLVHRYETEFGKCLYVSWWEDVQYVNKPNKGRLPRPDGTMDYNASRIGGSFQKSPGDSGKPPVGTGEQGNRGTDSSSELSDVSTPDGDDEESEPERLDVKRLVDTLVEALKARGVKTPRSLKAWQRQARLLLDTDGRPLDEALAVLAWSQADSFWSANVLSMPKFREKYDQLRLKAPDLPEPAPDPADIIRDSWRAGNVGAIRDRCKYLDIPDIRWPDDPPPDFDAEQFRIKFWRNWIEQNRNTIEQALKGAS